MSFLIRLELCTFRAGPFARRSRAAPLLVFLMVVVWSAWFHLPRTKDRPVAAAAAQSSAASSKIPTARAVRPDLSFCMGYTSLAAHWAQVHRLLGLMPPHAAP